MTMREPVTLALLGAGARGELNLGTLVRRHPGMMRFVAVAESDPGRREHFVRLFDIPPENAFADWRELTARAQLADAAVITLPCRMHYASTLAALKAGYHVLLEKPMSHSPAECAHLVQAAEARGRILMVSLQCRYNRIYTRVKHLLDEGRIGQVMNIDCAENIGYWHFIMSYVRGMHSHSPTAHSFMLSKAIHDIDLLNWFAGSRAAMVSSFGRLSFFTPENAPAGAPERCTDGCPAQADCPFDAVKQFLKPGRPSIPLSLFSGMSLQAILDYFREPRFRTLASTITHDIGEANVLRMLRETEHGKCVFHSGNDVVDHQVVNIEYENGVTVSFSLSGFSLIWERTCDFHGTEGEIHSKDFTGRLEVRTYMPARTRKERIRYHGIFHGGGDEVLVQEFARAVRQGKNGEILTSGGNVLDSHLIGFAAEEARLSNTVVDMAEFRARVEKEAAALAEQHAEDDTGRKGQCPLP